MRIAIVGAGPAGLFSAIALARRGHPVVVVDRDRGPAPGGDWPRRGLMQFHHAHTFRPQVVDALLAEMPDVLDRLVAVGATLPTSPDGRVAALLCRRSVFERVMRTVALRQSGVTFAAGHAELMPLDHDRVRGVEVGGCALGADLVIDASGRAGRFGESVRPAAEVSDCGAVYITRQYKLRNGAPAAQSNSPIGLSLSLAGYAAIAFLHDDRTFSVTLIHDGSDDRLRLLRDAGTFDAAVGAIPRLADWAEPTRAQPISPVIPGGRLYNSYRGQCRDVVGLISVGDAVCTTTPLAGRGVALALTQARELVHSLDRYTDDLPGATKHFDKWCAEHIRPWFDDHRYADTDRIRRWSGGDVDLGKPLPSDLIVAAAEADPNLQPIVGPYARMDAPPASLAPARATAHALFAGGWRPQIEPGPTRAELARMCATAGRGAA